VFLFRYDYDIRKADPDRIRRTGLFPAHAAVCTQFQIAVTLHGIPVDRHCSSMAV
jgi:hypothetical protein